MFGYHSPSPIHLTTRRMVVRSINNQDVYRLAEYYRSNREFLKPWEPTRDPDDYSPAGWKKKMAGMAKLQKSRTAYYFVLLPPDETEIYGRVSFSHIVHGAFSACYLGYSLGKKWQGQGLMYEALQSTIDYIQCNVLLHRIMANYMPHNYRSGNLLTRLGFEREGYARDYLQINGRWCDHILTALTDKNWVAPDQSI